MTIQEIRETLQGKYEPLSNAAIFVTLNRISKKSWVALRKSEPRPERGGKGRIHSLITDKGRNELIATIKKDEMLGALSCSRPKAHQLMRHNDGPTR
jgi:predicted transcriptional regulator